MRKEKTIIHQRSMQEVTKRRTFQILTTSNGLVHTRIEKTLMVLDRRIIIIRKLVLVNLKLRSTKTAKHNIRKVVYLK